MQAHEQPATWRSASVGELRGDQRLDGLETLRPALDTAPNARAVLDLRPALTAEQAMIQNEQMRLQGLAMAQAAEERLEAQRRPRTAEAAARHDDAHGPMTERLPMMRLMALGSRCACSAGCEVASPRSGRLERPDPERLHAGRARPATAADAQRLNASAARQAGSRRAERERAWTPTNRLLSTRDGEPSQSSSPAYDFIDGQLDRLPRRRLSRRSSPRSRDRCGPPWCSTCCSTVSRSCAAPISEPVMDFAVRSIKLAFV